MSNTVSIEALSGLGVDKIPQFWELFHEFAHEFNIKYMEI